MNIIELLIEEFKTVYFLGMVFMCPQLVVAASLVLAGIPLEPMHHPFSPAFRFIFYSFKYLRGSEFFEIANGIG